MRISIFNVIVCLCLLAFPSVAAAKEDWYCDALTSAKTYSSKKSYKYLLHGKDGWLFRSKKDFKQDFSLTPEAIAKFSALSKAMKNKGVHLHITMPPTRGALHVSMLEEGQSHTQPFDADAAYNDYLTSIEQLQKAGLSVADFKDSNQLESDFYYARDHHWTLAGADFSARRTADLFDAYKSDITPVNYVTENTGGEKELDGSFEKLVEEVCAVDISGEKTSLVQTYKEGDLFEEGNDAAAIALIGTSNCTEPNPSYANFAGYLREYIGADVENVSIAGGGIDTPMLSYLASEKYQNAAHQHVIWELASHYDFNGSEFEPIFRQIIPAAKGSCDGKALVEKTVALTKEKIPVSIEPFTANSYISLKFDAPVKRDFALVYKNNEGKSERFRFKRSDRYPHDGIYYLEWGDGHQDIVNLALLLSKDFAAKNVTLQVCPDL